MKTAPFSPGYSSCLHGKLTSQSPKTAGLSSYCFHRLAVHEGGSLQSSPDLWLQIWEAGRRALSSASSARAAAFALDVLLSTGLLGSSIRPSTLESTLFGGGNNGPSSLTDTTLVLLTSALRSDLFENDRQFESFAVKVIGWLTLRWTLRMYLAWLPLT